MEPSPSILIDPPQAAEPHPIVDDDKVARRFALLDLLILLTMVGIGLWSAPHLQFILRVTWNYVGTAPWPAYATATERYLLGTLWGLVASGPLVLIGQFFRGRRTAFAAGEWLWLFTAGELLAMVLASTYLASGGAYLVIHLCYLLQFVQCYIALRTVVLASFYQEWSPAWTQVAGMLACFSFAYGIYFALFVGTISGGRMYDL